MYSEGFNDAMFDTYDTSSTEFNFYDSWIPNNPDQFAIMTDHLPYQPNSWKNKPLNNWTSDDRLHWMCNEATNNNRNYEEIKLQNFRDITNETFRNLCVEDFVQLCESSEDGQLFYKSKQSLFKHRQFDCITNQNGTPQYKDSLPVLQEQKPSRLSSSSSESSTNEPPARKRPGRPRSSHTVRRKPEKRMGKLWEFLRNLLLDAKTCPSLIKWDNYNEGTFKFVQSEKVAQLWGDRKKNDKMNYEKLSRAMRYYYKSEVLLPVQGKRLVYKFGPQSTGWQTATPILEDRGEVRI